MFDFIIIGGGIIGLLTAKELQQTGAKVAVIEKNSPGQQASWAAGGILSPMRPWLYTPAVNAISRISELGYEQLSTELHQRTGINPEWVKSGMLVINDEGIDDTQPWCQQNNLPNERLSCEQTNSRYPHLKPTEQDALLRPDVATIRPHRLLAALEIDLADKGVTFFNGHEAQQFQINQSQISGIQTNHALLQAAEYIVCGGVWSPELLPDGLPKPDITAVKGQMICFPPVEIPDMCMIMEGDRYIIPRLDGRIIVGSTRENTGFDASTTQQAFDELSTFAKQLFPTLENMTADYHWAGLRPTSPDSIAYICRVEPYKNLSLNAGHYRNGIVTAPASARLMADILLNKPTSVDPSPYQINRG